jgi:hypothetical protein
MSCINSGKKAKKGGLHKYKLEITADVFSTDLDLKSEQLTCMANCPAYVPVMVLDWHLKSDQLYLNGELSGVCAGHGAGLALEE